MGQHDRILACEVFNRATRAKHPITDAEIVADCCTCGAAHRLVECLVAHNDVAEYRCPSCGELMVSIRRPAAHCGEEFFLLLNPARLFFRGVVIPSSEDAFVIKNKAENPIPGSACS